jgi:hypothetical protein
LLEIFLNLPLSSPNPNPISSLFAESRQIPNETFRNDKEANRSVLGS